MWRHFVAMGDSITEGVGDWVDGIDRLGWVEQFYERLAPKNPGLRFTNLARRGLVSSEIRATQLEKAVALQGDLVSVIAGGNDILLRGKWDPRQYEKDMALMLDALTATGATVMTSTILNFRFLPVPDRMMERMVTNLLELNEIIRQLARRYKVVLAEAWNQPATLEPGFWSADRIHPNAFGYSAVAQVMYEALLESQEALTHSVTMS